MAYIRWPGIRKRINVMHYVNELAHDLIGRIEVRPPVLIFWLIIHPGYDNVLALELKLDIAVIRFQEKKYLTFWLKNLLTISWPSRGKGKQVIFSSTGQRPESLCDTMLSGVRQSVCL